VVGLSIAGAIAAIAIAGRVHAEVGPFDTTLTARPSLSGATTLHLAPFGTIELDTHDAPFDIALRVDELQIEEAQRIARNPAVLDSLEDELVADSRRALRRLAVRILLATLVGGLAGAMVATLRWRRVAVGAVAATLVPALAGGVAWATFDERAVAEPRYSGLLTIAPAAVGDVEGIVRRFGDYRVQLADLVGNVATLYQAGQGLPTFSPSDGTIRLLHVADIHLNPQGFDLIDELVKQFDVDAVVDSGDTTDWGSEPETRLLDRIGQVGVPYVWARGNHDSPRTQSAVAAQANAVVLDGGPAEVAGVRFWGIGDPRYTPDKDQRTGTGVERETAEIFADEAARRLGASAPVDVVVVHDARIAAGMGDLAPLVLAGHTHKPREKTIGAARVLIEGSTGGAGLRGLQGEQPHPLTASVLYLDASTRRLVAYDRVSVAGLGGTGARIERHIIAGDD